MAIPDVTDPASRRSTQRDAAQPSDFQAAVRPRAGILIRTSHFPNPTLKRPSRKLTYLTWATTIVVLGALWWLSFQEPHGPSCRLPDGSTVELAKVTYGREHRFKPGNLWQQLYAAAGTGMGPAPDPFTTQKNAPVLWLRWKLPPPGRDLTSWAAAWIDEHGCVFDTLDNIGPENPRDFPPWRDASLTYTTPDVYPRRSGQFRLALVNAREERPVPAAELDVRVPSAGPFPVWKGQALPVTARSGNVEFVLERLCPGPGPVLGFGTANATFHYRENGRSTGNWRPEEITVLDATGNINTSSNPLLGTNVATGFNGLCWHEPAWKLRVRFARSQPERAPARFVWRLPPLPVPRRNRRITPGIHLPPGPIGLQLVAVRDNGDWFFGDGTQREARFEVKTASPATPYTLALIRSTNERGHELPLAPFYYESVGAITPGYEFTLPYAQGTKQLRLTFGLYETHTVEFLVKPN